MAAAEPPAPRMTSSKPYLLRAIYEWIVDNGMTPHLLVDTRDHRVNIPLQYVRDHSIVLNLAPGAVKDLMLRNDYISFSARFAGVAREVLVPVSSARMIYARENGQGMTLPDDPASSSLEEDDTRPPDAPPPAPTGAGRGSHLRRVK